MTKCCRHFGALSRKNWINWYRRPKCSFFEILWPVLTMFVMVFMRYHIKALKYPYDRIIPGLKMPTYPGLSWESSTKKAPEGTWYESIKSLKQVDNDVSDFFDYTGYSTHVPKQSYKANQDIRGPFYFLPSECLKDKSFQLPTVESPIIAVVGEWNKATTMMQNYLQELITF